MKNVPCQLQPGSYDEKTLVTLICTERVVRSYEKLGRFQSSNDRKKFLEDLGRFCEFEAGTKKRLYTVLRLLDIPVSKAEAKLHRQIYRHLAATILERAIYEEDNSFAASVWELARMTGAVNQNYIYLKTRKDLLAEGFSCRTEDIDDFCEHTDPPVKRYIQCTLDLLAETHAIAYDRVLLVSTCEDKNIENDDGSFTLQRIHDRHIASPSEEILIGNITDEAERACGIRNSKEKGFGLKAKRYGIMFHRLLAEHNITSCQNGYKVRIESERIADTVLNRLCPPPFDQRKIQLYEELGGHLRKYAVSRAQKEGWDTYKVAIFDTLLDSAINPGASLILMQERSHRRKRNNGRLAHVQFEEIYRGFESFLYNTSVTGG